MNGNGPEINKLFMAVEKLKASDLHLKADSPPLIRLNSEIQTLKMDPLSPEQIKKLVYGMLTEDQIKTFEETGDLDIAHSYGEFKRARVNIYRQRGHISMAARRVVSEIPNFTQLHLPPVLERISSFHQGLVLVTGITGSGKSTTLASMIDYINQTRRVHIVTIEDPIEYLHRDKKSFINQREIGLDTRDWITALRAVVREDPDVILVGEMRDPETFAAGLTAAETGHLVFGTLHSSNVSQTFGRILDLFPPDRQKLIRQGLQFNLRAIISQTLLPSCAEDASVVPACEIMITTPMIRKLIGENQDAKIVEVIRGGETEGMQDFVQAFAKLVNEDLVLRRVALDRAPNRDALEMELRGIRMGAGGIIG